MSKQQLLLIGAGGHARACIDVIEVNGDYEIAGLVGQPDEAGSDVLGYPILGTDSELHILKVSCKNAHITVGHVQTSEVRTRLFTELREMGYHFPVIISPFSYVSSHAILGAGTIVMHGAVINAGARVGQNCIVNSQSLIEHDSVIGDHCHVSTGAIVNGNVLIGEGSFLGSSCAVREGLSLGKNCLVGMGLSVRHDYPDGSRIVKAV